MTGDAPGGRPGLASTRGAGIFSCMDEAILQKEALKLPVPERALLADALLSSLDTEASRKIERAWAEEAEDRHQAYRAGELKAVDGPNAIKELRTRRAQ